MRLRVSKPPLAALLLIAILPVAASAQDPFAVAPRAYQLQFENDWVKVVRVHYEPHEKIAAHDHPRRGTIFVYLKDGGPVRFSHVGEESYALTRPPIAARGFRLARPVTERHEVENMSDLPSDFLRVEFKTTPVDVQTLRGRFPPPDAKENRSYQKVEFENGQVRIIRIHRKTGEKFAASEDLAHPALVIALTNGAHAGQTLGQTRWIRAGEREEEQRKGAGEKLRIEFKSEPAKADEREETHHGH